ncbi:4a-hydroxytetrahydrobiopterin dehydratase [Roseimaritima ulvae]|nr:4a-hydroxytetrahydrobiopterin dehydratase [Roseimaritima ulvae]
MTKDQVARHLQAVPNWQVDDDQSAIRRTWKLKNFVEAMRLLQRVGELAEAEQHHPDLHLTGYRHVAIVLTTHAIGGLSENDFIVAAKIDALVDDAA